MTPWHFYKLSDNSYCSLIRTEKYKYRKVFHIGEQRYITKEELLEEGCIPSKDDPDVLVGPIYTADDCYEYAYGMLNAFMCLSNLSKFTIVGVQRNVQEAQKTKSHLSKANLTVKTYAIILKVAFDTFGIDNMLELLNIYDPGFRIQVQHNHRSMSSYDFFLWLYECAKSYDSHPSEHKGYITNDFGEEINPCQISFVISYLHDFIDENFEEYQHWQKSKKVNMAQILLDGLRRKPTKEGNFWLSDFLFLGGLAKLIFRTLNDSDTAWELKKEILQAIKAQGMGNPVFLQNLQEQYKEFQEIEGGRDIKFSPWDYTTIMNNLNVFYKERTKKDLPIEFSITILRDIVEFVLPEIKSGPQAAALIYIIWTAKCLTDPAPQCTWYTDPQDWSKFRDRMADILALSSFKIINIRSSHTAISKAKGFLISHYPYLKL